MSKPNLINPQITFYIRTAKKLGFVQKSKKSALNEKQLKQIAQKKSKIPVQNQILYYNGEQVKQNKNIQIADKSIVHVLDSRNIGKSKMKLLIKRLPQNSSTQDFQVDSNTSIDDFIKKQLSPFYEEPAEKLFFVYSGRQLRREKSFSEEHVESQTEIVCVHAQRDRKNKKPQTLPRQSVNAFKTKDILKSAKIEQSQTQQQKLSQAREKAIEQKKQQITSRQLNSQSEVQKINLEEQNSEKKIYQQQKLIKSSQVQQEHPKAEKKLIKSIQQIECDPIESDEDSDNEINEAQVKVYPQRLPEEFLIEQTRPRSHTRESNNNNSGSSSISEPNFKKKKKASEVQTINRSLLRKDEQSSPKSAILQKIFNDASPPSQQTFDQEKQKVESFDLRPQERKAKIVRTRDQIFENSNNTFTSVIDEPEESFQNINLNSGNPNSTEQRDDAFNPSYNRQQEEIYDSQMNYSQVDSSKLEVKCNKGFMNFSNASFLEPTRTLQSHQRETLQSGLRHANNTESAIKSNEGVSQINNRAPQFLGSDIEGHSLHDQSSIPRKQSAYGIGGDSLSFSKEQSEMRGTQDNEDNLFVDYRRGPPQQQSNNIMIQQNDISESNLLSDTYHNHNVTEMMNSITFNLEPNPDEVVSFIRQSQVNIVPEEESDEQLNAIAYEKRESQIQTNFRDSANPSQICSNSSEINNLQGNLADAIEPMSLIEGLMSSLDFKITVNSVESEESDEEESNHKMNYVDPESDISYNNEEEEENFKKNHNQPQPSNLFLEEQSNVFVQYQSYRADVTSDLNEFTKQKLQTSKQNETNLLEQNSFGITYERSLESNFMKKNTLNDTEIEILQQYQDSAIKIIEEDSLVEQEQVRNSDTLQFEKSAAFMNNQEADCSGAFHQISQSLNEKVEYSQNTMLKPDNNDPQEVTFRKDQRSSEGQANEIEAQSRIDEPQASNLLYQLSLQALNQTEQPQLLPGDYIYSTDQVQTPDEALESILNNFTHCF